MIDNLGESGIITQEELATAIEHAYAGSVSAEEAKRVAEHISNFFESYGGRIIDNVLEPKDRDAFYMLEDRGLVTTDREETTLYDGREWRIHYWLYNMPAILNLSNPLICPVSYDENENIRKEADNLKVLDLLDLIQEGVIEIGQYHEIDENLSNYYGCSKEAVSFLKGNRLIVKGDDGLFKISPFYFSFQSKCVKDFIDGAFSLEGLLDILQNKNFKIDREELTTLINLEVLPLEFKRIGWRHKHIVNNAKRLEEEIEKTHKKLRNTSSKTIEYFNAISPYFSSIDPHWSEKKPTGSISNHQKAIRTINIDYLEPLYKDITGTYDNFKPAGKVNYDRIDLEELKRREKFLNSKLRNLDSTFDGYTVFKSKINEALDLLLDYNKADFEESLSDMANMAAEIIEYENIIGIKFKSSLVDHINEFTTAVNKAEDNEIASIEEQIYNMRKRVEDLDIPEVGLSFIINEKFKVLEIYSKLHESIKTSIQNYEVAEDHYNSFMEKAG